jgi:putative chitinase
MAIFALPILTPASGAPTLLPGSRCSNRQNLRKIKGVCDCRFLFCIFHQGMLTMVSRINREFFFESVRSRPFGGPLSAKQRAGLTFILDVWEKSHAEKDDRWLAYALGTAFHEVDRTMHPIHEYGGDAYFTKMYDVTGARPHLAKKMGNTQHGDGPKFHGRGYVQLTWKVNYAKMGTAFGVDLTSSRAAADRVLDPGLAAKIMFKGMEEGAFTGKGFRHYFNATTDDWVNARRIINGLDKANTIAGYAKEFYRAISYTTA